MPFRGINVNGTLCSVSDDVEALREHYRDGQNNKRYKPPKRVSTAPPVEDAKLYRILVPSQKKPATGAVSGTLCAS